MPPTPQSPARSSRRPNVTEVIGRFENCSVDVCMAGDVVALHFGTRHGVVVVSVGKKEFVEKCRGPVDHNGNPLPDLIDFARCEDADVVDHAAEQSGDKAEPYTARRRELYVNIVRAREAAPEITYKQLCAEAHVDYQAFASWLYHQREHVKNPVPEVAVMKERELALQSDGNAPVLKPGGKVL